MEDESEKCIPLKREDRYLEREKRRAENEIETRNKKKKQTKELERELEVCRNKCNELSVELDKKKMECVGFEAKLEELAQYKMMYNGLKQQMTCLEEDRRVVCQSENKAQEWIAYLSEQIKKMERGDGEKFAELEIKIRDLESGKRRAEDEHEGLKRRFTELGKFAELEIKIRDLESGKRRAEDEHEGLKKRFRELGNEFSRYKHEVEVEKVELHVRRTKYGELSMELETKKMECSAIRDKFEDLMVRKIAVEDELKECKAMCNGLKEKITCIAKDQNNLLGREIKAENQELEFAKRREEAEIDFWRKRFKELETEAAVREKHEVELERELDVYRTNCDALSKELKKMERDEKEMHDQLEAENQDLELAKRRAEAEIDFWRRRFEELESRVLQGTTLICSESHVSGVIESEPGGLPTEVSHNDEKDDRNKTIKLQSEAYGGDINGALGVHVIGAPSFDMQSLPVVNVEEDLEFGKGFGKRLVLELEENNEMQSVLELGSIRPISGRIIDVSDDSLDNSLVKEKDLAPKKCLKRLYSDQRGEIYGSRCNEDSPFTSSPKLKRASETPNASCGGLNVQEKNGCAVRTSPNEHTSLTQLDMGGKSDEKVTNQTAEKGKEKMEEEVGSYSEDESSDSGYSSSDSEDSGDLHLVIDKTLKKIFNRDNQSNLKVEADKGAHKLQDYRPRVFAKHALITNQ